mmetsp:Transcript_12343/g.21841  ORF Transcript_12343/g.21841 Transcript_12343/m.21841 type:complete len:638 (+) Transcript_12343:48-1961(+)
MSLSEEKSSWLAGLSVVKLKQELKDRGLAVSGLKAELAARLKASLEAEGPTQDAQKEEIAEPAPQDEPASPAAVSAPQPEAKSNSELQPEPVAVPEPVPVLQQEIEAVPVEAPVLAVPVPVTLSVATPALEEEEVDYGDPDEPATALVIEDVADVLVTADSSKSELDSHAAGASQHDEGVGKKRRAPIPLYQPRDRKAAAADAKASVAEGKAAGAEGKAAVAEGNVTVAEGKAAAEDPLIAETDSAGSTAKPSHVQALTAAPASKAEVIPAAKALPPQEAVPAAKRAVPTGPVTAAIRVENLVRPFTEGQLKTLLQQTCTVVDMWMPSIKTHAVVIMESEEQGSATFSALHGLQWPQGSPKKLSIVFIPVESAEQQILEGNNPAKARTLALAASKAKQAARAAEAAAVAAASASEPPAEDSPDPEDKSETAAASRKESMARTAVEDVVSAEAQPAAATTAADPAVETASVSAPAAAAPPVKPTVRVGMGAVAAAKAAMAAAADARQSAKRDRDGAEDSGNAAKRPHGAHARAEPMDEDVDLSLDDLFKKTVAKPAIYWLPLTNGQVLAKKGRLEEEESKRLAAEASAAAHSRARDSRAYANGMPGDGRRPPPNRGPSPQRTGYGGTGGYRDRDSRRW